MPASELASSPTPTAPRRWPLRPRFSLRLLLLGVTAFAVGFPIWYRWPYVEEELTGSAEQESVAIRYVARLAEDVEVMDEEELARLSPFHIWTDNFAVERLKWKKKHPLHVLLLRIFRLSEPIEIPMSSDYLGCKSWIRLPDDLPQREMEPVLSDAAFEEERRRIKDALKG